MKQLKITLVRGFGGKPEKQRKIAIALGLHRKEQVVYCPDTAVTRGMVAKIPHLLQVEEYETEERAMDEQEGSR